MNPALYVIAILGCGEGEAPCEQLRLAEARYESREACLAATETELSRAAGAEYPLVVAECREQRAAAARRTPAELALPEPDRRPSAWDE